MKFKSFLSEARYPEYKSFKELDAGGFMDEGFGPFPVEVKYLSSIDSTSPNKVEIELLSVKTTDIATQEFEDDKPAKNWPKGTDVTKMPGWNEKVEKYIMDSIADYK